MNCETHIEDIQAYLDDELPAPERAAVAEHLAECESCRATLKEFRAISAALTTWTVPEPAGLPTAQELLSRARAEGLLGERHGQVFAHLGTLGHVLARRRRLEAPGRHEQVDERRRNDDLAVV